MKLTRNTILIIAKNKTANESINGKELNYNRWVEFIDAHPEHFIWKEFTKKGIEALNNIEEMPENFKKRVLASINKGACYKEFDEKKGYYNISISYNPISNSVTITFERKPKPEDLKIFVEMAKYLDAFLLKDGTKIIDEKVIEELSE